MFVCLDDDRRVRLFVTLALALVLPVGLADAKPLVALKAGRITVEQRDRTVIVRWLVWSDDSKTALERGRVPCAARAGRRTLATATRVNGAGGSWVRAICVFHVPRSRGRTLVDGLIGLRVGEHAVQHLFTVLV